MNWKGVGIVMIAVFAAVFLAGAASAQEEIPDTAEATPPTSEQTQPVDAPTANSGARDASSFSSSVPNNPNRQQGDYASARVLDVRLQAEGSDSLQELRQVYDIELRSGEYEGQQVTISSDVESNPYQLKPREGDKVVIFVQKDDSGNPIMFLEGFDRRGPIIWIILLFVLTLVLLAGWQGLKIALSIIISVLIIGWVLIPAFLRGLNPVPIAMVLAAVLTFVSTGLSLGWRKKAWITALGTLGGVLVAYTISAIFAHWGHLSGLGSEEDRLFFAENPTLNPSGLLFAGIIIAAMGVIEDVAVSIASGVEQVAKANNTSGFKSLFTAGMVVGKDHMAAMANTLVFAYVGASLSTLLLYTQYDASWLKFLNFESVSEEVIRSLGATIGLIFTVPITALLSAWFAFKTPRRRSRVVVKEG